jgi:hypothetical protein
LLVASGRSTRNRIFTRKDVNEHEKKYILHTIQK